VQKMAESIRYAALLLLVFLHPPVIVAQSDSLDTVENAVTVSVTIAGVEDELLSNVRGFLPLYRFNEKEAPSEGRLRFLHALAEEAVVQALAPFGYYRPTVIPSLELTEGIWQAQYEVTPGEQIRLQSVDVKVSGEAETDEAFLDAIENSPLKPGEPLKHEHYEALKQRFQVLGSERGYFDANLTDSKILIDLEEYDAEVVLHFDSGHRYYLGDVSFQQEQLWLSDDLLSRYSEIEHGQPFLAGSLQQLQGDLSNTGYYDEVTLDVSPENADEDNIIPIIVNLKPRNPTRYVFGAGFGTDTGVRVKAGVTRRRINQAGHHFTGELLLAQLKYGLAGEYTVPGSDPRTDAWGFRGSIEDEDSDTSDFTSSSLGGFYRHRDGLWIKTYALDYLVERFEDSGEEQTSKLLIPSIDWTRTFPAELEKRIDPAFGTLLQLTLKGGSGDLLSDTSFIQPLVYGKWIYSFGNSTRLIARGAAATTYVDDFDRLPTSLRFFTGGDKTVRGYSYNVISPVDEEGFVGARNLLESSLEYEVPIKESWRMAAFVDVGDAYDNKPDYKTGIGFGVRWISPIGPVRLDLAHGLNQPPGRNLRLHLTIGSDL